MRPEGKSRRSGWAASGWLALIAGLVVVCALLVVRGLGAGGDAFNRDVGWANIVGCLLAALGIAFIAADKIGAHRTSAPQAVAQPGSAIPAGARTIDPPYGLLPKALRGRDKVRTELRGAALAFGDAGRGAGRRGSPAAPWVLHGMGGVGKTAVALWVAREVAKAGVPVFWVVGDSTASLEAGMREAALRVGAPQSELSPAQADTALIDTVWKYLEQAPTGWLLIIDNVDDPQVLAAEGFTISAGNGWFRASARGAVIATSRVSSHDIWGADTRLRHLLPLGPEYGGKILLDLTGGKRSSGAGSFEDAKQLSQRLGGLPLALRGAGTYLASPYITGSAGQPRTFDGYRDTLDKQFAELVDAGTRLEHAAVEHPDERILVMATWELSLDLLADRGMPEARLLLRLLSCFAPQPVPLSLLDVGRLARSPLWTQSRWRWRLPAWAAALGRLTGTAGGQQLAPLTPSRRDELIAALSNLTLLEDRSAATTAQRRGATGSAGGAQAVSLHPLVIETTSWLTAQDPRQNRYTWMTAARVADHAQKEAGDPTSPAQWSGWQALAPHLVWAARTLTGHAFRRHRRCERKVLAGALTAGRYQSSSGQVGATSETYTVCRDLAIRLYGERGRRTRNIRRTLARSLWNDGQRAEADQEFFHDLNLVERALRKLSGSSFAAIYSPVALYAPDRTVENDVKVFVDEIQLRMMRWFLLVFRWDTPRILVVRFRLADLLSEQGDYDAAGAQFRRVLDRETRTLGAEHPETLITRKCLAGVLADQGELRRAADEYRAVLDIQTRVLGPEHPHTLDTRYSLADVALRHGNSRHADAEHHGPGDERAEGRGDGPAGPRDHASQPGARPDPGDRLPGPTDPGQAEAEYRDVLAAQVRTLGPEHPNTLVTRHRLARVLADRGDLEQAEAEVLSVLDAQTRKFGPGDRSTLGTRYLLAGVLARRRKLEQAEGEYRAVIDGETKTYGAEDRRTLFTRRELCDVLADRGQLDEAEAGYRAIIDAQARTLGGEHGDTLASRRSRAAVLARQRDYKRAEAEYRAVLGLQAASLGADAAETLITRYRLARVLEDRGSLTDAETEYRTVFDGECRTLGADDRNTLITRRRLAEVLAKRDRLDEAEAEYRAILAAQTRILGADDRDTLLTRFRLAEVLADEGEFGQAETEYRAVLAGETRTYGAADRTTLITRRSLASVLGRRERVEEAEAEYRAVVDAQTQALGADDRDTLRTRHHLGDMLSDRGDLAQAEATYRAVLGDQAAAFGADHGDTLATRRCLARVLADEGDLEQGEAEYRAVLDAQARVFGADHTDTLRTRRALANLLRRRGNLRQAEAEYRSMIEVQALTLGADHPRTLVARHELGDVLAAEGDMKQAREVLQAVLDDQTRVLGADDPASRATRRCLDRASGRRDPRSYPRAARRPR